MDFRTFYGCRDEARKGLVCDDPSLAQQEYLKESLTSTIIDRFARTGVLTPTCNPERVAKFGDFSQCPSDLLEAHERLENVRSIFEDLPSKVRARFGNNPLAFVQFMSDPSNRNEAIDLGLIAKPVEKSTPIVEPKTATVSTNLEIGAGDSVEKSKKE